jgi:hypothetical protein
MLEQICIDSSVLGTEKHLLLDEGYLWSSTVPAGFWHLSGKLKTYDDRCLDTLLKLNGTSLDVSPPARFVSAMSSLVSGSFQALPWSLIMPADAHRAFVKRLINSVKETFPTLNRAFYEAVWVPEAHVLRSLAPAKIDRRRFEFVLEESGMNHRVVDGFKPGIDGFAVPVTYDRFGTRTGRLTVESGPHILTIKKQYRDMIVPSHLGGSIVSLDFSALEARVLLYEAGGSCPDVDLYSYISSEVFGGSVDRKAAKGAVISELYGSSKTALGAALGIGGKELDDFVAKVKSYFKTIELKKRVKDEFLKTGTITNRYGRRIVIEEPLDHIFVNSYAQSTGVDVALLGFSNIVEDLSSSPGIRPLFVLHDALILDVAPEDIEKVMSIKEVKVPGYVQVFPIKPEILGGLHN